MAASTHWTSLAGDIGVTQVHPELGRGVPMKGSGPGVFSHQIFSAKESHLVDSLAGVPPAFCGWHIPGTP